MLPFQGKNIDCGFPRGVAPGCPILPHWGAIQAAAGLPAASPMKRLWFGRDDDSSHSALIRKRLWSVRMKKAPSVTA